MNIKALERITGKPVKRAEKWDNCIFVIPAKGRPTFVSVKKLDEDFVNLRIEGSHDPNIRIEKLGIRDRVSCWAVTNSTGKTYKVFIGLADKTGKVSCTCPDFQKNDKGHNHLCKHIRKVLREGLQCQTNDPIKELIDRLAMPGSPDDADDF